jgi:hypothetical protein
VSDDRHESDWDDDDRRRQPDDDYRPPRHRYGDERDDYDDERSSYSDPRKKVVAPGIALMIVGVLGAIGSLVAAGFFVFVIIESANRAGGGPGDAITAGIMIVGSGLSMAACIVIAMGGAQMRRCRNYGLAMAAAIISIASIALCGLFSVVVLPFGIWALVVLSNSEVKREFRRTRKERDLVAEDYSD